MKTIAKLALAVNIFAVPAMADAPPTRETCKAGLVEWTVDAKLVESIIRSPEGLTITLDPAILAALPPDLQEHVQTCVDMLQTAPGPESWPYRYLPEEQT